MMMFPILLIFTLSIGLTCCNDEELITHHSLVCEELCDVVLQKFFPNESKIFPFNINSEGEIANHDDHRNNQSWNEYLEASSIIFALSKKANKKILSKQCFKDFKSIESGILSKEPWAMKVRDSSGGKESGFIWGHNYWLGNKQGCDAVQNPVRITLSDKIDRTMKEGLISQMAPFKMDYRVVYMIHNSPWQIEIKFTTERIIHLGLCLPSSCSSSEVKSLTQTLMDENLLAENKILELHAEVMYIKDLQLSDTFFEQKSMKITIGCVIFTLIMTLMACFLSDMVLFKVVGTSSKLFVFIKCFDIRGNSQKLFTLIEPSPNSISIVNGLRSVSCFWVLMCHSIMYTYFTVNNKTFLVSYGEQPLFQYVTISPIIVDLLFSISGFLQAYSFFNNENQLEAIRESTFGKNAKIFGKLVLNRYLRLAPLYLVVIAFVTLLTSYMEDVSVFHIIDRYDQVCSKYWWRNVLFIQNFFDHRELCLNWSWSLACEMQFYLLVSGLLFAYPKHPNIVEKLTVTGIIASILWSYYLAIKHQFQFSFDKIAQSGNELYINPFIRVTPYLAGSLGGYYLARKKESFKIGTNTEKYLWNLTALVFIACIYSNFKRDLSPFCSITLLIGSRLSIAIIVCWMIIASATGHGNWLSKILECKIFQHTNRLSYAIYLLNPPIISLVFSLSNFSSYADPLQSCILATGFGVITYLASIIFSLAFEIPYCNLSSIMLKRNMKTD